jgi:hypothetical protein
MEACDRCLGGHYHGMIFEDREKSRETCENNGCTDRYSNPEYKVLSAVAKPTCLGNGKTRGGEKKARRATAK